MAQHFTYYSDLKGIQLSETNGKPTSWVKMMNYGTYKHAVFGDLVFDLPKVRRFSENQKKRVRGTDLDIDYDHKLDRAKGNQAAGWVQDTEVRTDGLYALIEWTPTAADEIKEGKWRYISPEFVDEWTDPLGVTHQDVLVGGGITNRPFLKDLLPINLSELVFDAPAIGTPPAVPPVQDPQKEKEVDPKQLREQLGLPAEATDEQVTTRLGLLKQLSEAFPDGVPTPPKNDPSTRRPEPPTIQLGEDVRQLAEANPTVKALVSHMEDLVRVSHQATTQLREEQVSRKLTEFNTGRLALTRPASDLVMDIMLSEGLRPDTESKIWQLMEMMKNQSGMFIELGERASTNLGRYGVRESQDPAAQFKKLTEVLVAKGVSLSEAYDVVARENPKLYEEYRSDSYAFRTQD
jgi:hypothetical protein